MKWSMRSVDYAEKTLIVSLSFDKLMVSGGMYRPFGKLRMSGDKLEQGLSKVPGQSWLNPSCLIPNPWQYAACYAEKGFVTWQMVDYITGQIVGKFCNGGI